MAEIDIRYQRVRSAGGLTWVASGAVVGVLLVACTPATARTPAELQDSYGPLVSDLQTELRTRLPDLTWQETTAEARRDGNACLVQLRTSGTSRGPRAEQGEGAVHR